MSAVQADQSQGVFPPNRAVRGRTLAVWLVEAGAAVCRLLRNAGFTRTALTRTSPRALARELNVPFLSPGDSFGGTGPPGAGGSGRCRDRRLESRTW